jgi:hypothetical protein
MAQGAPLIANDVHRPAVGLNRGPVNQTRIAQRRTLQTLFRAILGGNPAFFKTLRENRQIGH